MCQFELTQLVWVFSISDELVEVFELRIFKPSQLSFFNQQLLLIQ